MSERKWLPAEWLDESVPKMGATPDEFLKRTADGVLQLTPLDEDEEYPVPTDITEGQAVGFCWFEPRGWQVVTIEADGTWAIDEPFEQDTNCYCDGLGLLEVDNSLQGVVDALREGSIDPDQYPYRADVQGWTWSDEIAFRVEVLESGAARFVEASEPCHADVLLAPTNRGVA